MPSSATSRTSAKPSSMKATGKGPFQSPQGGTGIPLASRTNMHGRPGEERSRITTRPKQRLTPDPKSTSTTICSDTKRANLTAAATTTRPRSRHHSNRSSSNSQAGRNQVRHSSRYQKEECLRYCHDQIALNFISVEDIKKSLVAFCGDAATEVIGNDASSLLLSLLRESSTDLENLLEDACSNDNDDDASKSNPFRRLLAPIKSQQDSNTEDILRLKRSSVNQKDKEPILNITDAPRWRETDTGDVDANAVALKAMENQFNEKMKAMECNITSLAAQLKEKDSTIDGCNDEMKAMDSKITLLTAQFEDKKTADKSEIASLTTQLREGGERIAELEAKVLSVSILFRLQWLYCMGHDVLL